MELDAPLRIHVSAKVWGCSSLVGCLVRLRTELYQEYSGYCGAVAAWRARDPTCRSQRLSRVGSMM